MLSPQGCSEGKAREALSYRQALFQDQTEVAGLPGRLTGSGVLSQKGVVPEPKADLLSL